MKISETSTFNEFLRFLDIYLYSKLDKQEEDQILKFANFELLNFLKMREDKEKGALRSKSKRDIVKWFSSYYKTKDDITKALLIDSRKKLAKEETQSKKARKAAAERRANKKYLRCYGASN